MRGSCLIPSLGIVGVIVVAGGAVGCSPENTLVIPGEGMPLDALQSRLASVVGNRLDIEGVKAAAEELRAAAGGTGRTRGAIHGKRGNGGGSGSGTGGSTATPTHEGDWNYVVGGPVNGGVAVYTASWGATASCSDRLFVPVNATSNNVWAFDNLYPTIPGSSTACTNGGSDGGRCTSPYCPRRIWTASLSGRLERSSLTLSLDGTAVYAATTNGVLYALDTATGAELWKLDTRTSAELGSSSGATFLATSP
jgi:outer membrane protein assembly factor BamB